MMIGLQAVARTIAPNLSDAFYQRLAGHPLTAEYIDSQIEKRKETLEQWFLQLFSGEYDTTYVESRLKIGQIHVAVGLPVRYPLAMMDVISNFGAQVTTQSQTPEQAIRAFRKLLALDIAIFTQAYEDTQLAHLAEMMGNERLARRLLTRTKNLAEALV